MNKAIPTSLYESIARCLREYQLSYDQEKDLMADAGFYSWYAKHYGAASSHHLRVGTQIDTAEVTYND